MAFTVVPVAIAMALEYCGEVAVGVVPSVVYRIVAPLVDVEIVTFWPDEYMPPPGEMKGAVTVNVYVALPIDDAGLPVSHALAFNVVVCVIESVVPEATVESVSVGSAPLVV